MTTGSDVGQRSCIIIGPGRAGQSFSIALERIGWTVVEFWGRHDDISTVPDGVDLVLLTVSDEAIASVAARLGASAAVVAHVSGVCDLDVLGPHTNVGSLHPLMSLPDAEIGAARLLDACTFAVDGDSLVKRLVDELGGNAISIPASQRALYHATACIAANHLVALCDQIEHLAAQVGVPAEAYWKLMTTTFDNVIAKGAQAALTGPAARGDWETVKGHIASLASADQELYLSLSKRAATVAGQSWPKDLVP
ncbi:MAG: putative short-subunit dehydrogenase-like oxidoreductase (DUF2520 family) [Acidimicrobiales bacterium]|jgi:predicted short-subunit dehydrogenase-like oxidoreductase (DUF2520 family)